MYTLELGSIPHFISSDIPSYRTHAIRFALAKNCAYRSWASINCGLSRNRFHALLNRAMVAPSTTLWSAAQETVMMCAGTSGSSPPPFPALPAEVGMVDAYRGLLTIFPMAPIATCGANSTGDAYVPPMVPMLDKLRESEVGRRTTGVRVRRGKIVIGGRLEMKVSDEGASLQCPARLT